MLFVNRIYVAKDYILRLYSIDFINIIDNIPNSQPHSINLMENP